LLKKIFLIFSVLLIPCSYSFAQVIDTLFVPPEDTVYYEESLTDKVCSLFTANYIISSEDIENSIYRNPGDLLKMNRAIDVTGYGPYGQPQYATVWGSTSRQLLIYQDGISFFQQNLYMPQTGDFDLFDVPLENIESIRIIDNPVVNILGPVTGLGGLRLKPKDYKTGKPFSRINFEKGPYGFRRTQVELGRALGKKTRFYFTYGRKKSDGYVDNSDFKSLYLTGNINYKIKNNWRTSFRVYHYENRAGNPLPYESSVDLKTEDDRWILALDSEYRFKDNSLLNIEAYYSHRPARSYNGGYFLDREWKEKEFYLKGSYEFNWNSNNQTRLEGFLSKQKFKNELYSNSPDKGYLSYLHFLRLSSDIGLFLFLKVNRNQGFDWNLSGAGGASYQVSNELSLFSTFSRVFSHPTLYDKFVKRNAYAVNSDSFYFSYYEAYNFDLNNEVLNSGSFGFSWIKNDFELRNSYFFSWNCDNIEWAFSRTVDLLPAYTSIRYRFYPYNRERKLFGLSLIFDYRFSPEFKSGFSYAYKWNQVEDEYKAPFIPEHSLFTYFQFSKEFMKKKYELKFRLEQEYISKRYLADYNRDEVPFILLFNSKVTFRILDLRFYYVFENITNETYRTRGDFTMPGRTLWFGLSWDFYD